jgi:membrane associated rhomboid family serine protease
MTPWVTRLLIANIGMFVLQAAFEPVLTNTLMFVPAYILARPWTIVTYMFLHGGIGHIFFNMLALYFFGPRVESRIGSRRFFTLYMWSGIAGALLSFLFAPFSAIIGASGATFGVMLAFAFFWPGERLMIWGIVPVEARVLVLITTLISIFGGFTGSSGGIAHYAHLGGFAGAWLYLKWLEHRSPMRQFRSKAAPRITQDALANWGQIEPSLVHEANRGELVRVLDKAKTAGLGSLTPQERAFLASFIRT